MTADKAKESPRLCKNGVKEIKCLKIRHLTLAFVGHSSDIMVDPEVWDTKKECIKAMVLYHRIKRINFANSVMDRKELMLGIYSKLSKKKNITSEEFGILIDQALHPENYHIEEEEEEKDFFDYYTSFLDIKEYEPSDRKNFDTMGRLLNGSNYVGDVVQFTWKNVINDHISYTAKKQAFSLLLLNRQLAGDLEILYVTEV